MTPTTPPTPDDSGQSPPDWHTLAQDEALAILHASPSGLNDGQVQHRLAECGENRLPAPPATPAWIRFARQFRNVLIYLLIAAAVLTWLMGHRIDSMVILAVITVNAIVGYIQEGRAEQALAALRRMMSPQARVLRDGAATSVPVAQLVPGDVVLLEAGDRVPADLRLLRAHSLTVDEAVLTGESVPVVKQTLPDPADAPLAERHCMAYSGTLIAAGQGAGLVIATGARSEIGRISTMVSEVPSLATPLLRQINSFSRQFGIVVLIASIALFFFAWLARGYEWDIALMAVISLAVSVVPEGLPAVMTITLAIGVQRMVRRNAIIRRLPAVETLGATSIICSDKTGTLTRNEMTATRIITAQTELRAEGAGYAPDGRLRGPEGDDARLDVPPVRYLVNAAILCNTASLRQEDGAWLPDGDPMEAALLTLGMKAGSDPDAMRAAHPMTDQIPFDPSTRYMATLHAIPDGEVVYMKGAPEQILKLSHAQLTDEGRAVALDESYWQARIAEAAARGERVLGFAAARHAGTARTLDHESLPELMLLGLVSFIDPPRDEAREAVRECRSAGIQVKMITGDHAATATAIARQLGIDDDPTALTGDMLDQIGDDDLPGVLAHTTVFARTSPAHKLRIVRALQSQGNVVAMTGDGVNDAPALKQADVGVAMGVKGTEAAKESAEMVLADDNFASIVAAVREGRTVYDNIRKVVSWTLPTNGGEVLTVIIAIMLGMTLPMSTVQILWINLATTITLGLALAFEPSEPGIMERAPRDASEALLSRFLVWRTVLVSLLFAGGAYAIIGYAAWRDYDLETSRTLVVNVIVAMEISYLFAVRYLHQPSITWRGVLGTPAVLISVGLVCGFQLAFTYLPWMQLWFQTRALTVQDWLAVFAVGAALLLLLELEKKLMRGRGLPAPRSATINPKESS